MGIKTEQYNKVQNMEPLNDEDRKAMLKDTQRAGFDPSIHQVRATFDLTDAIEKLDKRSTALSKKIYWLTWAIAVLTLVMTISTIVMIFK